MAGFNNITRFDVSEDQPDETIIVDDSRFNRTKVVRSCKCAVAVLCVLAGVAGIGVAFYYLYERIQDVTCDGHDVGKVGTRAHLLCYNYLKRDFDTADYIIIDFQQDGIGTKTRKKHILQTNETIETFQFGEDDITINKADRNIEITTHEIFCDNTGTYHIKLGRDKGDEQTLDFTDDEVRAGVIDTIGNVTIEEPICMEDSSHYEIRGIVVSACSPVDVPQFLICAGAGDTCSNEYPLLDADIDVITTYTWREGYYVSFEVHVPNGTIAKESNLKHKLKVRPVTKGNADFEKVKISGNFEDDPRCEDRNSP